MIINIVVISVLWCACTNSSLCYFD